MPPKRKKKIAEIKCKLNSVGTKSTKIPPIKDASNIVWRSRKIKTEKLSPELKDSPKYSCAECKKKFRFRKSYERHLEEEHSKTPGSIKCNQCFVVCPNKTILKAHITKFHERKTFTCPNCEKTFVRHSHVLRHLAQKGCDGNTVVTFPCEICDAKFTRKDNLMVHLRLQHIEKKGFRCKLCEYHTRNFSKLIAHRQKTHTKTNQYECDHCGKTTSSRAAMTKHLEIHGEKKYECEVCGYKTYTVEVIRRHVLTHVRNKPFKCNVCDKSYIQRAQLTRHLFRHTGYLCTACGSVFKTESALANHTKKHFKEDGLCCPFSDCPHSEKEFPNEAALDEHMKLHNYDKPFKCNVCKKSFRSEANIRRHLVIHTLDKPRRCMYCVNPRAYVRGEQLVKHVRKSHPDVFRDHLSHVRQVMGSYLGERVSKSELDSILNVLDAESERIVEGCSGDGVFYGGMQERDDAPVSSDLPIKVEGKGGPLMSEEELTKNMRKLLSQLIDEETLACFGWPDTDVDEVLEKVIEHCGAKPAERSRWSLVQRLRENTKRLFLYVIEDDNVARMLDTHTIDQIIHHILKQVTD